MTIRPSDSLISGVNTRPDPPSARGLRHIKQAVPALQSASLAVGSTPILEASEPGDSFIPDVGLTGFMPPSSPVARKLLFVRPCWFWPLGEFYGRRLCVYLCNVTFVIVIPHVIFWCISPRWANERGAFTCVLFFVINEPK